MVRDGYQVINDQIRPKQTLAVPSNQPTTPSNGMSGEMQQSDSSNAVPTPLISGNSSLNNSDGHQNNTWAALPPGNNQNLHMLNSTRPMDAQLSIQQQQQNQHALMQQHAQRSSLLPSANPLSQLNASIAQNSNVQLGNHMMNNKPSHSQIQMLHQQQQQQQPLQQQQQQQEQQQQQMQRKLMMGLGTAMNLGNMGQNVVGLGGLGNVLGTGGVRGIGGPGRSGPGLGLASSMGGPISGITNMNQNPMNATNVSNLISQQLRNGKVIHAQAAAMASKRLMQTQGCFDCNKH